MLILRGYASRDWTPCLLPKDKHECSGSIIAAAIALERHNIYVYIHILSENLPNEKE